MHACIPSQNYGLFAQPQTPALEDSSQIQPLSSLSENQQWYIKHTLISVYIIML